MGFLASLSESQIERFFELTGLNAAARARVTSISGPEKFCPCRDPSLPYLEEIRPRPHIWRAKKGFRRDEACQEQEFRMDNLPSLLSWAQPLEQAKPRSPAGAYLEAERVHSG